MKFLKSWLVTVICILVILVFLGSVIGLLVLSSYHPFVGIPLLFLGITALVGWLEKDSDKYIGW